VTLPADARLSIDGRPTRATSARRSFVSPPLEAGATYAYTLQATVQRDGREVTQTKDVVVRAGQESTVSFDFADSVARK